MKTKKNFSPIVSHYKSFFADTFLKFISINRNIENSFYLNKSKKTNTCFNSLNIQLNRSHKIFRKNSMVLKKDQFH